MTGRRQWLKRSGLLGGLSAVVPSLTRARPLPYQAAVLQITNGVSVQPSSEIDLAVARVAENGAVVPVSVSVTLAGTEQLWLLIDNHPHALLATLDTRSRFLQPTLALHARVARPCRFHAIVQLTDGSFHAVSAAVDVVHDSCEH